MKYILKNCKNADGDWMYFITNSYLDNDEYMESLNYYYLENLEYCLLKYYYENKTSYK